MEKQVRIIKYLSLIAGICAVILIGHASPVFAATEFMTSWQTKTYTPDWYMGKAFPTYQSFITVTFELIENGKAVDLSKTIVRWYVDDKLFKNEMNGLGIKKLVVYNQKYGGDVTSIKISLPSYKGSVLEKTIDIPVKDPEVVIDVPFFQKKISTGENTLFAWPFYFNALTVNSLGLQWRAAGGTNQAGKLGEPFRLTVGKGTESGVKYEIGATIGNLQKTSESAVKNVLMETL